MNAIAKHEDDWQQVAAELGNDIQPQDCVLRFCQLPLEPHHHMQENDPMAQRVSTAWQLGAASEPEAVEAASTAAWNVIRQTNQALDQPNIPAARRAALSAAMGVSAVQARVERSNERQNLNLLVDDYVKIRLMGLEEKVWTI